MKKIFFLLAILFFGFLAESFSQLSQSQANTFFERFTDRREPIEQLFNRTFLEQVPVTQLTKIRDEFENRYGKYVKVEIESGNKCKVYYEKAIFPCVIAFDHDGHVSTLWFGSPSFENDKIEQIKQELTNLEGIVALCIHKDWQEVYSLKSDLPLAIGSTFKLYVLKALVQKIKDGRLKWEDTLHIDKNHKSLPTGILHNWPENQTLTINTVANLMISQSDNTATDMLIDKIGREYIEQFVPSTMIPFYKTKELFVLKLDKSDEYIQWFLKADMRTKRLELEKMDTVDITRLNPYKLNEPKHLEIEWLASTKELCQTIESLKDVPALSINPGLLDKNEWYYIAYKGGSEPGVLNYTYLLQKKEGSPLYTLSATINNAEQNVDGDHKFTMLIKRIIDLIAKQNNWDAD